MPAATHSEIETFITRLAAEDGSGLQVTFDWAADVGDGEGPSNGPDIILVTHGGHTHVQFRDTVDGLAPGYGEPELRAVARIFTEAADRALEDSDPAAAVVAGEQGHGVC